jgi:hypothetical protein
MTFTCNGNGVISVTRLQCILLDRCTVVNGALFACADMSQSVLRILPLTESSTSFSTIPLPVSCAVAVLLDSVVIDVVALFGTAAVFCRSFSAALLEGLTKV